MTNFISGYQGAAGIMKMEVMKAMISMASPPPAGNDGLQQNPSCLTLEPVMSTGIRARMATMRMRMRRNKHCKPMMDQCRMWRTEGIVLESVKIGLYISDL